METIIDAVDPRLIEQELIPRHFLRHANNAGTDIYTFTAHEAPHTMRELGRLRELAFRDAGGGTGKSVDIDDLDICEHPYHQLVVWDPQERMILGGYRYSLPGEGGSESPTMATGHLFGFSPQFRTQYLPYTIELGRSFVQPVYQSSRLRRKGIYALDNLWDGLGALVVLHPNVQYFFGKVTMYTHYNQQARNTLHYFLQRYFPDPDRLAWPKLPLQLGIDRAQMERIFTGASYKENFEILNAQLANFGEKIPPLIKSYIGLSSTMRTFGTALNPEFGNVEETGRLVRIADVYPDKSERHVESFRATLQGQ